jgi:hypothetical protein
MKSFASYVRSKRWEIFQYVNVASTSDYRGFSTNINNGCSITYMY